MGREGELIGYELLYRARATDDSARFDDEHSASLHVLSTLLHDLGAPQVLAGRQAFINVGAESLRDAGALVLLNPRRTVLELSHAIALDADLLERIHMLREMGFGIAVPAAPPMEALAPWLSLATHLKVDLQKVPDGGLDVTVTGLADGSLGLIVHGSDPQPQLWCDFGAASSGTLPASVAAAIADNGAWRVQVVRTERFAADAGVGAGVDGERFCIGGNDGGLVGAGQQVDLP
jgi:hypothetical protein